VIRSHWLVPPPEPAIADYDDITAACTEPEPAGPRDYVIRYGSSLTHATLLRLEDAQAEARQWRKQGRQVAVCELREVDPSDS